MKSLLVVLFFVPLLVSCALAKDDDFSDFIEISKEVINYCISTYDERDGELDISAVRKAYAVSADDKVFIILSNGGGIGSDQPYKTLLSCGVEIDDDYEPYYLGTPLKQPKIYNPNIDSIVVTHIDIPLAEIVFVKEESGFIYSTSRWYDSNAEKIFGIDCSDGCVLE